MYEFQRYNYNMSPINIGLGAILEKLEKVGDASTESESYRPKG